MKRTLVYLGIFLILGGLVYYFSAQTGSSRSTIDTSDRRFAVEDTDRIGKIFIATRTEDPVLLSRKGNDWYVNEKYLASSTSVEELLRLIRDVQLKFVPPRAAYQNAIQTISSLGIKVEIYDRSENLMRSYYIGGVTSDEKGTYFLMEGANQPYVMHIPYWQGSLRTRFSLREHQWRDRAMFAERLRDIKSVKVNYPNQRDESFAVERVSETEFSIRPLDENMPKITRTMHPGMIESYLRNFQRIGVEAFENNFPARDSILTTTPFSTIELTRTNGEVVYYDVYPRHHRPLMGPYDAAEAEAEDFQLRFWVSAPNGDFMSAQYRNMRKFMWGYSWFFRQTEDT